MTTTDDGTRPPGRQRRYPGLALSRRADRLIALARRRGARLPVLAAFATATLLAVTAVVGLAGWQVGEPGARWAAELEDLDRPSPTPPEEPPAVPPRQPPQPMATGPAASPVPPPVPPGAPAPGDPTGDFVGWAVLDLASGTTTGSSNLAETSTTASMIKAWIVADYLRLTAEAGDQPDPERIGQLQQIIRDSHNGYTEVVFDEIGEHASIERLIQICALTDSQAVPNRWSNTRLSPRDTTRMGACIADGRAAGPEWTAWLLDEMQAVRGIGDFGIRHAFPPDQRAAIAIKNGWVIRSAEDAWHVNCLAIGDGWTMGVMTRYPAHLGYTHGAEICRSLAAQQLT